MRNLSTPEKRKLLRQHWLAFEEWLSGKEKFDRKVDAFLAAGILPRCSEYSREIPEYPEELRGLECGATTRKGTPCKQRNIGLANGRCKFHGGDSTGPRTRKGKKRSALNGLRPKRRKRTT